MQANGITHYIYADVLSWAYACDQSNPNEAGRKSSPRIHLDTIIEQGDIFQDSIPLGLCAVCDDEDLGGNPPLSPWQLDLIHAQEEPPIPRCLETVIALEEKLMRDLKECLFLTAKSTAASVQVKLAIQEKPTAQPDYIAERSFEIVEFGYTLNYQKESK